MTHATHISVAVAAAVWLIAAPGARADVILVPDSTDDRVMVLDQVTGDVINEFDTSTFSATGIECIDGPDGTLLLSDQTNDMVYQLNPDGTLIGEYLSAPVDNIRGIHFSFDRFLLGATAGGIFGWDENGDMMSGMIPGDFFDIINPRTVISLATNIGDDDVEVWCLRLLIRLRRTPPSSIDFPEQLTIIRKENLDCIAVNSFTPKTVYIYRPDGQLDSTFELPATGRGIIQLGNGNLLVSTSTEIAEYTVDGDVVRQIAAGSGFRFFSRSKNFK